MLHHCLRWPLLVSTKYTPQSAALHFLSLFRSTSTSSSSTARAQACRGTSAANGWDHRWLTSPPDADVRNDRAAYAVFISWLIASRSCCATPRPACIAWSTSCRCSRSLRAFLTTSEQRGSLSFANCRASGRSMSPAKSVNRTRSPKLARFSIGDANGRSSSVFTRSRAGWPPLQSNSPARSLTIGLPVVA